jgi:hypothetical protein
LQRRRRGVEQQTLEMALQRFTRRAAEAAEGTGEAKDALAQMGIALRDQSGNLRSSEDLLPTSSAVCSIRNHHRDDTTAFVVKSRSGGAATRHIFRSGSTSTGNHILLTTAGPVPDPRHEGAGDLLPWGSLG